MILISKSDLTPPVILKSILPFCDAISEGRPGPSHLQCMLGNREPAFRGIIKNYSEVINWIDSKILSLSLSQ